MRRPAESLTRGVLIGYLALRGAPAARKTETESLAESLPFAGTARRRQSATFPRGAAGTRTHIVGTCSPPAPPAVRCRTNTKTPQPQTAETAPNVADSAKPPSPSVRTSRLSKSAKGSPPLLPPQTSRAARGILRGRVSHAAESNPIPQSEKTPPDSLLRTNEEPAVAAHSAEFAPRQQNRAPPPPRPESRAPYRWLAGLRRDCSRSSRAETARRSATNRRFREGTRANSQPRAIARCSAAKTREP